MMKTFVMILALTIIDGDFIKESCGVIDIEEWIIERTRNTETSINT